MKKLLFLLTIQLLPMIANPAAVEIDGIYYELITKIKEAKVTKHPNYINVYRDDIIIPTTVSYNGVDYTVKSIDNNAFASCMFLKSVSIPQSVSNIGERAFHGCQALTTVPIPNGVKSIGREAFYGCSSIISITIPASVESIGDFPLVSCDKLQSISVENGNKYYDSRDNCNAIIEKNTNTLISGCMNTIIPNNIEKIGISAFEGCIGLKSVTIPNSVTSIGGSAFYGCSGLTSVTLSNSLTSIELRAFLDCKITSINIPNSVKTIGDEAFYRCGNLSSIILGEGVTEIGSCAFSQCIELTDVYCYAKKVPANICLSVSSTKYGKKLTDAFDGSLIEYSTLHVPNKSIQYYQITAPWSGFGTIVSLGDEKKCAKPSISYTNGNLKYECTTEGVQYISVITDTDINKHFKAEIPLTATYIIAVYATKEGYENSEVTTATLCWIDAEPMQEGTKEAEDAVTEVKAMPVLIQAEGNIISVQGAAEGTDISVYNTAGIKLNSAIANNGITTLNTTLPSGSTAIVKIGEKAVKVLVK